MSEVDPSGGAGPQPVVASGSREGLQGTSAAYRGQVPAPSARSEPGREGWAPEPRAMRGQVLGRLSPGGLYVGAEGSDRNGWVYRLIAPLDRGGMGELFVAEVRAPDAPRYAVVKRLLPELMDDRDYVAMFQAEAEVMARLDHPSVVRVLGMPELEGAPCLALEFIEGRSAQQLVSRARNLGTKTPAGLAAYIATRVAEALDHVHDARAPDGTPLELVHRDVTPGNVLLGFDGAVKLTDFGIAKSRMSNVSTTVGIVKGKARYLAPEQILGRPASPRSDVFSAALVLVELLTGEPLFERGSIPKTLFAIVHGERPPMRELLPPSALSLAPVLEQALATAPEHRPASARAFAEELGRRAERLGAPVDADALGHHLRGIFTGTRGPLTRALEVPPVDLPAAKTGGTPLNPESFGAQPDLWIGGLTPLPLLDPVEVDDGAAQRSAPHEVDEALSVLAWLQSRDASSPPSDDLVHTVVAPPPNARSRAAAFVRGLLAGAAGVALTLAALWGLGGLGGLAPPTDVASQTAASVQATPAPEAPSAAPEAPSVASEAPASAPEARSAASKAPAAASAAPEAPAAASTAPEAPAAAAPAAASAAPEAPSAAAPAAASAVPEAPSAAPQAPSSAPQAPSSAPQAPAAAPQAPSSAPEGLAFRLPALSPDLEIGPPLPPPAPPPPAPATLTILTPRRGRVWVDGERLPDAIPLRDVALEPGPHTIAIRRRRYERILELRVEPGEQIEIGRDLRRDSPEGVSAPGEGR